MAEDWDTMGELFTPHKKARQEKRRQNLEYSTQLLRDRGVAFTSHSDGVHLIVVGRWDFWPSTGKWKERKTEAGKKLREGRGVRELLTKIAEDGSHV